MLRRFSTGFLEMLMDMVKSQETGISRRPETPGTLERRSPAWCMSAVRSSTALPGTEVGLQAILDRIRCCSRLATQAEHVLSNIRGMPLRGGPSGIDRTLTELNRVFSQPQRSFLRELLIVT